MTEGSNFKTCMKDKIIELEPKSKSWRDSTSLEHFYMIHQTTNNFSMDLEKFDSNSNNVYNLNSKFLFYFSK